MTSYLRSIFGSASSSPTQVNGYGYGYPIPGSAPSSSYSISRERSNSFVAARANAPSPLRYGTYDSSSARSRSHAGHQSSPTTQQPTSHHHSSQSSRSLLYRSASHKAGDRPSPYPIYTPTGSFSSVRSSNSSIYPGPGSSSHGHRSAPPRTSSSASVATTRSVLKTSNSGHSGSKAGPHAHVSFENPNRPSVLHMHPILAYGRLHRSPLTYDVTFTPSSRTVLDRHTLTPIPGHTLAEPATEPPTLGRLVLKAEKLPWPIIASVRTSAPSPSPSPARPRFYLGGSSGSKKAAAAAAAAAPPIVTTPVSNLDVLYALHVSLSTRVTQQEWDALGHGSKAQRKVSRAYEKRCTRMGGGWESGVRRIDFLEGKTKLVGIEMMMDKNAVVGAGSSAIWTGKAIFVKP
ncbi:hypothetical protein BDQ17DRAFT_312901 [Cyathus striatus]|nr:hypothetical protein BDQ17DRAFT_312901 [Cyathus striatus]